MATEETTGFTLEQRDAMSIAFSAGNYANAYESHALSKAWRTFTREHGVKHMQLTRAAFVLGFFGTYSLAEMIGSDRTLFDSAYRSPAGRYVVEVAKYTDDRAEEYAAEGWPICDSPTCPVYGHPTAEACRSEVK